MSLTASATTRRNFLLQIAATGGAALAATPVATPGPAAMVNEKDATAAALGYASDNTKVDKKKFPQAAAALKCSACQLYQGKAGESSGPCPIFAGKLVSANGWCSSFVKKAA
jgi:hypothetical protein